MINFPVINEDRCQQPAATCVDPRCSDPTFAAANPLLCSTTGNLVVKPEVAELCAPTELQFGLYARTPTGDVEIADGITWSSSNSAVMTIGAVDGKGSALTAGLVTITATWQGVSAFAQVNVLGVDGSCCDGVQVEFATVVDNSLSMSQPFGGSYPTKLSVAKALLQGMISQLQAKDIMAVGEFNDGYKTDQGFTSNQSLLDAAVNAIPTSSGQTNVPLAIQNAQALLAAAPAPTGQTTSSLKIILLVSDGDSRPLLSTSDMAALLNSAKAFKASGGVIMCCGIRAKGDGFNLLDQISSGGFFINVFGSDSEVSDAITRLTCSMGYVCAGSRPPDGYSCAGYGYNCCDAPIGPQEPDPTNPWDLEDGSPPQPPPQLPPVQFSPADGTFQTNAAHVSLSVPGHPNAAIMFSINGTSTPPDPSFSPPVGQAYEGQNAPVTLWLNGSDSVCIKAMARESGYADSAVSQACYPPTRTIAAQLSGLRWEMPLISDLTPWLYTTESVVPDKNTVLVGDPNRVYNVTLRFRGFVEPFPDYTGTPDPSATGSQLLIALGDVNPTTRSGGGAFVTGGTAPTNTAGNVYELIISDPPQHFFLNGAVAGLLQDVGMLIDYTETIQMRTGATVTMKASSGDGQAIGNGSFGDPGGSGYHVCYLAAVGVPPYPAAFITQYIQMDVVSVT